MSATSESNTAPLSQEARAAACKALDEMLADPEKLRKECDDAARAEHPDMTEEQLDWTWRQLCDQMGLESGLPPFPKDEEKP